MSMRSVITGGILGAVLPLLLWSQMVTGSMAAAPVLAVPGPMDAVSVHLPDAEGSARVRYRSSGTWSVWTALSLPEDAEPGDLESDLLMFPDTADMLEVTGIGDRSDVHSITVSREPVKTRQASLWLAQAPHIITRSEWGADASYLFDGGSDTTQKDLEKGDLGTAPSDQSTLRVKDCQTAINAYPDEFAVKNTIKKDAAGRTYRWPLSYSKSVKLLVVHHTALLVKGDQRPADERVRALYKYHAVSKGWGDIGYHYVIDEDGRIYEGRTGGDAVVGGHAYCNNIGTIGIVLMGNFEIEQPSQEQALSLQWLLSDLAQTYHIDLKRSVQFHGKTFTAPVVRHRDLLSTLCPGYYLSEVFSQIVKNVQEGALSATVNFPSVNTQSSSSRSSVSPGIQTGIAFIGRSGIAINPGGKQRLSFTYTAPMEGAYEGKKVADVRLSDSRIRLWVDDGESQIPVTKGILLPSDLPAYETLSVQLIVQAPIDPGTYWMEIGGIRFTLTVAGRRARTGTYINPFYGNPALIVQPSSKSSSAQNQLKRSAARRVQEISSSTASSASSSTQSSRVSSVAMTTPASGNIRIRLTTTVVPTVTFQDPGTVGGMNVAAGTSVELQPVSGGCEARVRGERLIGRDVLVLRSSVSDTLIADSVRGAKRLYAGTLECRVVDGGIALINELPIERYMEGLSEEPDSEPYEKQRAFAIAARTYVAHYSLSSNRKFPGKPYDGTDDPAFFQSYSGIQFGSNNPNWMRAVRSTAGQILTVGGTPIRPPYFSSDDGRTRSPVEVGWKNFPFADIFVSKSDPWCTGKPMLGHGVGMSGCGAAGQAMEGRSAEQILQYYYPGTRITQWP
jgi:peptidoglycan hydrolase-like amidase